jgi:hypothetical protein
MFVSSYNTYLNTSSSQKTQKEKFNSKNETQNSFSEQIQQPKLKATVSSNLPVNYISNYKALNNQQKLRQDKNLLQEKTKFTKINTTQNAKEAYDDNTKMFSFLIKPKVTLSQASRINKEMPPEAQKAQEKNLRNTMVNAYIANDNYYKITA